MTHSAVNKGEGMKLHLNDNYEIAVCGGGFAGISAALAAARRGKRVVLFEKEPRGDFPEVVIAVCGD